MSYLVASFPSTLCGETRGAALVNIINTGRRSREASSNLICSPSTSLVPILISVRDLLSNPISICATILPHPDYPIVDSGNYLYIGIPSSRRLPQRAPRTPRYLQGRDILTSVIQTVLPHYRIPPHTGRNPPNIIHSPPGFTVVVTSIRRACPTPRRAPSASTWPFRQGPVRPRWH